MAMLDRLVARLLEQGGLTSEIEKHAGGAVSGGGGPGKANVPERGITAYHASPHDFDRFDISKLRSGQGANTYGSGLYFAENPRVMDSYYRSFSAQKPAIYNDRAVVAGSPHTPSEQNAIAHLISFRKPGESVRSVIERRIKDLEVPEGNVVTHPSYYSNAIRDLKSLDPDKLQLPTAYRYKVKIGAEKEQLLDWDKPLKDQPSYVKEAIDRRFIKGQPHMEEADEMGFLGKMAGKDFYAGTSSRELKEAGIPGLRYLDRYSREKGTGTHNVVAFRDDIIEVLKKYGLAGAVGGAAAAPGREAEASPRLKSVAEINKPLPEEEQARNRLRGEQARQNYLMELIDRVIGGANAASK